LGGIKLPPLQSFRRLVFNIAILWSLTHVPLDR